MQQPFYLKYQHLYISDNVAKSLIITEKEGVTDIWFSYNMKRNDNFFNGDKKYTYCHTKIDVCFGRIYRMNILLYRNKINTDCGYFNYYIGGICGSYEMHGKNMKRSTTECNYNFIFQIYPFIKKIKNFKKQININSFYDIVSNSLSKSEIHISDLPIDILNNIRKNKLNSL